MIKKILALILTVSAMCFVSACSGCGVLVDSSSSASSSTSSSDTGTSASSDEDASSDSSSNVETPDSDSQYERDSNELPPVEIPDQN